MAVLSLRLTARRSIERMPMEDSRWQPRMTAPPSPNQATRLGLPHGDAYVCPVDPDVRMPMVFVDDLMRGLIALQADEGGRVIPMAGGLFHWGLCTAV